MCGGVFFHTEDVQRSTRVHRRKKGTRVRDANAMEGHADVTRTRATKRGQVPEARTDGGEEGEGYHGCRGEGRELCGRDTDTGNEVTSKPSLLRPVAELDPDCFSMRACTAEVTGSATWRAVCFVWSKSR